MSELVFRACLAWALAAAAWRRVERREQPLRLWDGTIVTWAYGDGRRDDQPWLQKLFNRGGGLRLGVARYVVMRDIRIAPNTSVGIRL